MRLVYADRIGPTLGLAHGVAGRGARGRGRGCGRKRGATELEAAKRKRARASEEADVEISHEIAHPAERRNRKVVLGETRHYGIVSFVLVDADAGPGFSFLDLFSGY